MSAVTVMIMTGCSMMKDLRDERVVEYRMITRNICIDNENEVRLAQHLYLYMLGSEHK
jgi:hypothetical protein